MNTLKLLDDIRIRKLQPFFAPVLDWRAKVLSIQHDLPYWWKMRTLSSHNWDGQSPKFPARGWYEFTPDINSGWATTRQGEMMIDGSNMHRHERDFLSKLSSIYVIALFPIDEMTWMVTPFNLSDAQQRRWRAEPRKVHLVNRNIRSGQVMRTGILGNELLFVGTETFLNNQIPVNAFSHADKLIQQRIDAIHKTEQEAERAELLKTAEGRIGASLEFMGASLKSWSKNLTGYNVGWELNGKSYSMEIDTNMRIDSAGVCLAGTDGWHSLASIVAVMEERGR